MNDEVLSSAEYGDVGLAVFATISRWPDLGDKKLDYQAINEVGHIGFMTTPGGKILSRYVHGFKAQLPFQIFYKCMASTNSQNADAEKVINDLASFLEEQKPLLSDRREVERITMDSTTYKSKADQDGSVVYVRSGTVIYEKIQEEKRRSKILRGQWATWISKDKETWTLIGVRNDSLETATNPDESNGKDVTGGSYSDVAGYAPDTSVDYVADNTDSIYDELLDIYMDLKQDDDSLTFYKLEAMLDIEVSKTDGVKNATGTGFEVPVKAIVSSVGGGTDAFHIAVNFREDHSKGGRVQGTVTVTDRQPTFSKKTL